MTKALHAHFPFHPKELDREVVSSLELKSASSGTFMSGVGISCLEPQYSGGLCRKFSVNVRPGRFARPYFKKKKKKRKKKEKGTCRLHMKGRKKKYNANNDK